MFSTRTDFSRGGPFFQRKFGPGDLNLKIPVTVHLPYVIRSSVHVRKCVGPPLRLYSRSEEVVQVYGFCIRTLHLPVISVMIIGVMRLSYNERAMPDGRFRHHLFQAVFMRTTYPSRYMYFGWSRVHTTVETAVTTPVGV